MATHLSVSMVTADPFQCGNIHMKRPPHHSLWLCYWLCLWLSKEPTWAGPRTSFLTAHSCERWRYSDLLPLKLQRTQQTLRVKMTFKAGSWRRFGDVSHISATASSVAERWAESHSSWSNCWSTTLIPLSSWVLRVFVFTCCSSSVFGSSVLNCTNVTRQAGEMTRCTLSNYQTYRKAQNVSMVTTEMKPWTSGQWFYGVLISDLMLETHDVTDKKMKAIFQLIPPKNVILGFVVLGL